MQGIKHVGLCANRISRENNERLFAEAWAKEAPRTLGYLLCGQDTRQHNYSQRDAEVAATVIQWLGSPVGAGFLHAVQQEITKPEKIKQVIRTLGMEK